MKNTNWWSLGVLALAVMACDPYTESPGGTPNIVEVNTTNGGVFKKATLSGTSYSVNTQCTDDTVDPPSVESVNIIWITFDRLLGGSQIQTSVTDCTPANGWLTITPAAPAGDAWYTCYSPASPASYEGGSVIIYLAPAGGSSGWADAVAIPDLGTVTMTGTVNGAELDLSVDTATTTVVCGG